MTQAALPGGLLCVGSTNQGLGCLGKGKEKKNGLKSDSKT